MGKAIQEVVSATGNGTHNIVLGADYRIYCTCKAWQFSRPPIKKCKHLEELFDVKGQEVMLALQKPVQKDIKDGLYIRKVVLD